MGFLEFKGVTKSFGDHCVLNGIDLLVKKGDVFGLVGRSGCGKSVLFRILMGVMKPDSGDVVFKDKSVLKKINDLRRNTGFVGQENMLYEKLSVRENAFYFGRLYGVSKKDIENRFDNLLNLLGLQGFSELLVGYLSGGMKKRADILVSLIHNPSLLILDEPTEGLDSILRENFWKYINKINKTGTTVVVTSHLLDEMYKNCDFIAIMKDGQIYASGSPKSFTKKYSKYKDFEEIFEALIKTTDEDEIKDTIEDED